MPKVTRIFLRSGATAASLGAFTLEKTAALLRAMAGDSSGSADSGDERAPRPVATDVPVERRGEARRVEPVVPPEKQPENPAAPAGADPDATSGTGPVPRRISNPKAARKVRKRQTPPAERVSRLETKQSAKGGKPSAGAERSPADLARSGEGRQPAPMGSKDSS